MKRFYCDLCENEMSYGVLALANTNDKTSTVLIRGNLEVTLCVTIAAQRVELPVDTRPGWQRNRLGTLPTKRSHADLCHACRWALLEQLRGGHTPSKDTPLPAAERELKWEPPVPPRSDDGFAIPD